MSPLNNAIISTALVTTFAACIFGIFAYYHGKKWLGRSMMFTTAVAMIVSMVTPANAVSHIFPNPNPIGSPTVLLSQLPTCTGITANPKGDEMAGQGWVGDWQMPVQIGNRTAWAALMLPCRDASLALGARVFANWAYMDVSGTGVFANPGMVIMSARYWCNNTEYQITGLPANSGAVGISAASGPWANIMTVTPNVCGTGNSTYSRIDIAWQTHFNGSLITGTASWRAQNWGSGAVNTKPTNIGQVPFPGGAAETPVLCFLVVDDTDILTVLSTFFGGVGDWFTCLWEPSGWDRSNQVDSSWRESGISRTGDILTAALPGAGSVVCGTVLDMNVPGFITYQMSTCPAANAVPAWVKIAIATVSIIAMLFLFIRRIQWTVIK